MSWKSVMGAKIFYLGDKKKRRRKKAASCNSLPPQTPKKTPINNKSVNNKPSKESRLRLFYKSEEWKRARYLAFTTYGSRCHCCGASPDDGVTSLVVDHIRPLRHHWNLRTDVNNLQVLCNSCNWGKGARDQTDWRPDKIVIWDDDAEI